MISSAEAPYIRPSPRRRRNTYASVHSLRLNSQTAMMILLTKSFQYLFGCGLYCRNCNRISKLLICRSISNRNDKNRITVANIINRVTLQSSTMYIKVIGYILFFAFFGDVTKVIFNLICEIGSLRLRIPFRRKHTLSTQVLQSHSKTTNASEQIYKGEFGVFYWLERSGINIVKQV